MRCKLRSPEMCNTVPEKLRKTEKKLCQCFFNNSVKHLPIIIIFGTRHREENWRKRL